MGSYHPKICDASRVKSPVDAAIACGCHRHALSIVRLAGRTRNAPFTADYSLFRRRAPAYRVIFAAVEERKSRLFAVLKTTRVDFDGDDCLVFILNNALAGDIRSFEKIFSLSAFDSYPSWPRPEIPCAILADVIRLPRLLATTTLKFICRCANFRPVFAPFHGANIGRTPNRLRGYIILSNPPSPPHHIINKRPCPGNDNGTYLSS